jgi:membrane-associated protease RseP (regulator of RpoE activity)
MKITTFFATLTVLCASVTAQNQESFGGTGMSVRVGKQGVSVVGIIPNSPAYYAGLQAGDIIVSAGGTELSSVEPEKQVSLLRGKEGTIANLIVDRNGKQIAISAKRTEIAVQPLEAETISNWYGKSEGLTLEEINFLASQKTAEGYEVLGVVQNGLPISNTMENLKAKAIQQISVKKMEESKTENKIATSDAWQLNSANREAISFSLTEAANARISILDVKGATVWQKNLGKLPIGASIVNRDGARLPSGFYQIKFEAGNAVSARKFELK